MRLFGPTENAVGWLVAAAGLLVVIGLTLSTIIVPLRQGTSWSIHGTGEGVSLVQATSGTAAVLYDLGVGGGLAVTQLGGRVMLWLANAVIGTGAGQSLIASSDGVTTLYDFAPTNFASVTVANSDSLVISRTAPEIASAGIAVMSTSSPVLTYFVSSSFVGKQDPVVSTDGSTWTHVSMTGIVTMQFNGTGYINVFTTVPDFAVINSTYSSTQYYYWPVVASATLATANDAVFYPPLVRLETSPLSWVGGMPTISWFFITGTTINTPVTVFVSFEADIRLT